MSLLDVQADYFRNYTRRVENPTVSAEQRDSGFWRKDEPILTPSREIVTGGMFAHQSEWWNLQAFIKGLVAGYGGGKTFVGAKRVISLALQNAPWPGCVVSPTFPMARLTTIDTIMNLLEGKRALTRGALKWSYNGATHEFRIKYRGRMGRIIVYSGERPSKLKGPNLSFAWIDEPFIQSFEVFEQIVARVRHPQAVLREILLTGTPEQLNWGYELAEGDLADKYDAKFVHADTRANKVLPPDYAETLLRSYDEDTAAAYVAGKFVNLAKGRVFHKFDRTIHVQDLDEGSDKHAKIPDGVELGCGMDFNVNPFAFVVFWKSANHIHFIDEFELANADTEYAAYHLREIYGTRLQKLYPDASCKQRHTNAPGGMTDASILRRFGFELMMKASNPGLKDSYNDVNGMLKPATGKPRMTVSPRCKKLIRYLEQYSHSQMNTEDQKAMSHLLDAMRYAVSYLFPIIRSTPQQARVGETQFDLSRFM